MRVEIMEDIEDSCGKRIKAKKGRQGKVSWLYTEYANYEKSGLYYIDVRLDGNKINRNLPNKKLKILK